MENTTTSTSLTSEQMLKLATHMMVQQDQDAYTTKMELVKQGMDEKSADALVANLEEQIEAAQRKKNNRDMLIGGLWMVGGIVVTAVTFSAASGGGKYVIAWGAIIFGGIQFFTGLARSLQN